MRVFLGKSGAIALGSLGLCAGGMPLAYPGPLGNVVISGGEQGGGLNDEAF